MRVSKRNAQRVTRLRRMIERLPMAERPLWRRRLQQKLAAPPALVVRGVGEATTPETQKEWDLQIANWLDNAYGIVSERVKQVGTGVADTVRAAGFNLWPLAIAAVAFAWAMSTSRRSGYGE